MTVSETRGGFFAGFEASEKRFVFIAATIAMLRMFGVFALLPVLSVHAATLADATPFLIGMAVGAYGLTQAGMQIPLGALSDRIGRRPVIAGALLLLARKRSELASMVEERDNYREEILRTVYPDFVDEKKRTRKK